MLLRARWSCGQQPEVQVETISCENVCYINKIVRWTCLLLLDVFVPLPSREAAFLLCLQHHVFGREFVLFFCRQWWCVGWWWCAHCTRTLGVLASSFLLLVGVLACFFSSRPCLLVRMLLLLPLLLPVTSSRILTTRTMQWVVTEAINN